MKTLSKLHTMISVIEKEYDIEGKKRDIQQDYVDSLEGLIDALKHCEYCKEQLDNLE